MRVRPVRLFVASCVFGATLIPSLSSAQVVCTPGTLSEKLSRLHALVDKLLQSEDEQYHVEKVKFVFEYHGAKQL